MSKVLFFDIDGTLVNFQGQMSESTRQALQQLQKNGCQIVLCSGRSKSQIYSWLLDLGFDGIIAGTGAYVECGGKVIYRHFMPEETIRMAIKLLKEANACYFAQAGGRIVMTAKNWSRQIARMEDRNEKKELFDAIFRNVQIEEHMEQIKDIEKLLYFDSNVPVPEIRKYLSAVCDVTESSFEIPQEDSGEITCRGINKAYGMKKYIEYVGISQKDTIAFGDGPNDFDMLEFAAVGIAMGNARDTLKQMANYVTTGVDQEGIAYALRELGLIESTAI